MKNVIPAATLLLFISGSAMAQNSSTSATKKEAREEKRETRKSEVAYQSKQQFERDFNNAKNVQWKVTKNFDEATFNNNGITTTAYYDAGSQLVGTTTRKSFSDIPMKAQQHIKEYYKGYKTGEVIMFDDNEANETDMVLYDTSFEDADNYFVSLKNNKEAIILKVNMEGEVSFFKKV